MKYNLTEKQKKLAKWIVDAIRSKKISEGFTVQQMPGRKLEFESSEFGITTLEGSYTNMELIGLAKCELLHMEEKARGFACAATGLLYKAVDSKFVEEDSHPISTLAQPHPLEITSSLSQMRAKYPNPNKLGFLVMRFAAAKPFSKIVEVIERTGEGQGLTIVRADKQDFHTDLWGNVRTYLHGCGFGIAVIERIESNEPNANVGLEVGYLMAMNKPVLLLKDKTVPTLQTDLAGKLYKTFDPHDPEGSIPGQMTKWLEDYGIIVPKHS